MKRLAWFSAVCAAFLAAGHLALAQVGAPVAGAAGPFSGTYSQTQQIASGQALATPVLLGKSAIAMVSPATGTMANNGAITVGTALPRTYAKAYFYLPASAISAASSAGWYYTECTTTTACTVYNNTYTTGVPAAPASKTAFATTGPGAYTGDTTEQGVTTSLPANAMGSNGQLRVWTNWSYTNSANNKTLRVRFSGSSGTALANLVVTTTASVSHYVLIANSGSTAAQVASTNTATPFNAFTSNVQTATIDTTAATSLFQSVQKANATDNATIEFYTDELLSDGT